MRRNVIIALVYAQLCFFGCLLITVFISSAGFADNHGLSFYGEHLDTVLPFGLGFVLCDFFLLRAASMVSRIKFPLKSFEMLLRVLAILLMLIVLTPDNLNPFFKWGHIVDSSTLFGFEMILTSYLTIRWQRDKLAWTLLLGQFISGVIAMLSEFQVTHYLSEGSLFFQIFFGVLLVWSISKIPEDTEPANEPALD